MTLDYDPAHARRWVPEAGTYEFQISSCSPAVFSTGSRGIRLQLAVDAGASAPLRIRSQVVFGERSTWKMLELCECVGVCFDPPCSAEDLVGKRGRAEFILDDHDGLISLAVARYLVMAPIK